eukprot:4881975-Amphidinium_carterae.1
MNVSNLLQLTSTHDNYAELNEVFEFIARVAFLFQGKRMGSKLVFALLLSVGLSKDVVELVSKKIISTTSHAVHKVSGAVSGKKTPK